MQIKRHSGAGLVLATLGLVALAGGCGGSSTKATPLVTTPTVTTASQTTPTSPNPTTASTTTAPISGGTTVPPVAATKPTAAQLAGVTQDLDQAGTSLAGGNTAINGSDVNQAKTQEGSAP